jgi:hypothetical protein
MIRSACLCAMILVFLFSGCGGTSAKRVVYDSLQNKADMDCQKEPGARCPERQNYDDYQRGLEQKPPGK